MAINKFSTTTFFIIYKPNQGEEEEEIERICLWPKCYKKFLS